MKKILFLITIICTMALQSCEKPLKEKVYGEGIYNYKEFNYVLIHKTSECKAIKNGITPIDTMRLWWKTDYYTDGVSVRYCSECLNDDEIGILYEHRKHQYLKQRAK